MVWRCIVRKSWQGHERGHGHAQPNATAEDSCFVCVSSDQMVYARHGPRKQEMTTCPTEAYVMWVRVAWVACL
eukprot:1184390-Amphidinium_carterae.1